MNKQNRKPNRSDDPKKRKQKKQPQRSFEKGKVERAEQQSEDFVIGKHAVLETLKSERDINKLFLQEGIGGERIGEILELAKERHIQIQVVPKSKLDLLSDNGVHQGIMLATAAFQYATLDDLFDIAAEKGEDPFFLILDGIEDPHNLGSILRTADASGCHGIIIPKRRAVGLTGTVAKASTGAIEHVPVVRVTNLSRTISDLKERGVWVYATDMEGQTYQKWDTTLPLALIIGNEGKGVSRILKDSADGLLTIPMVGHVQSLNASVAAALMMYEVFRKRNP
ncbi:23S rRNA (guanosine(2251)-2'-O)-methyltransferase RlmB [Jeotgalibaca ciconiae]|uniref:23S rRNA (Guanosine(2251)-2'-O)-methyltransferase RlmB n=1 Tax=Jeotgalibaca ciconiae TaxID=2496265 RepID=A0A3Q9BLT5_9LACT|nr:23S rRNA (guanosine(2251)-2'-O)-methyltransferase RlmB [Jeotgalibaca ciconiae]AZP04196.1 23S rRNA (guanosine(2251)-2'-O)-methyltransferase RlmB [Jeotgalibaca ciconiae]HJB23029.1 23S rRNA (guanosine(2251)-2'-O)-methyltransferase RlmB [Candidatus Jeotgalibaca pullicola]